MLLFFWLWDVILLDEGRRNLGNTSNYNRGADSDRMKYYSKYSLSYNSTKHSHSCCELVEIVSDLHLSDLLCQSHVGRVC